MAETPPEPEVAGADEERFSSPIALIIAALGMAIGTGNIWRFPRILSENGGGTFLIPWAIFLFTWSIPLLVVEFGMGRRARRGPVGAFATVFGPRTAFLGLFVAVCTLGIMFYYSVVTGWCLQYLLRGLVRGFADLDSASSLLLFEEEIASGYSAVAFHAVAILIAAGVVAAGVTRGIERACKVLIPALLAIMVIAAVRALTLPGAGDGLAFMLHVDPAGLADHEVWLEALSQSAWSTGAGWGLLLCYAIYAPRRQRIGPTCAATGIGNNLASLIAAMAIIPAVFALMPMMLAADRTVAEELAESGPASTGVTFVWVPVLLENIQLGGWDPGRWPAVAFFLTLSFAAISSLIAGVELGTRFLMDFGLARKAAVWSIAIAVFVFGVPSALWLEVFLNQDWVWGLGLIVSGGFFAFGVIGYGVGRFRREYLSGEEGERGVGAWFEPVMLALVPIQFVGLLAWWGWKSYSWTSGAGDSVAARLRAWLDPTDLFSIGTCVVQWGLLLAIGFSLNRWLARGASRAREERRVPGA